MNTPSETAPQARSQQTDMRAQPGSQAEPDESVSGTDPAAQGPGDKKTQASPGLSP